MQKPQKFTHLNWDVNLSWNVKTECRRHVIISCLFLTCGRYGCGRYGLWPIRPVADINAIRCITTTLLGVDTVDMYFATWLAAVTRQKSCVTAATRLLFGLFCCTSAIADVWWKRLNGTTRNSERTDGILSYTSHDVCQHRCFTPVSSWLPHSRCNDIVIYRPHDDDVITDNSHHNSNTCITFTNCVSGNDAFVLEQASSGNFSAVSFKRYCKSQLLILTGLDISNI